MMNKPVRANRKINVPFLLTGLVASFLFASVFTLLGRTEFLLSGIDYLIDTAEQFFDARWKINLLSGFTLLLSQIPFIFIPSRNYKVLKYAVILYPAYIALSIFQGFRLFLLVSITVSYVLFLLNKREGYTHKQFFIALLGVIICTLVFEVVVGFAKTSLLPNGVLHLSEVRQMFMCIDYFLFLGVLMKYAHERRDSNASIYGRTGKIADCFRQLGMYLVLRRSPCVQNEVKDEVELTRAETIFMVAMQPIQLLLISFCVAINNRFIVFLLLFFAGFLPQRLCKTHTIAYDAGNGQNGKWYACLFQTVLCFYVVCAALPTQHLSLVLPTLVGSIVWLYTVKYELLRRGKSTVYTAEPEEIAIAIELTNFDKPYHKDIVYKAWVDRNTIGTIADTMRYSESQISKIKERYRSSIEHNL